MGITVLTVPIVEFSSHVLLVISQEFERCFNHLCLLFKLSDVPFTESISQTILICPKHNIA